MSFSAYPSITSVDNTTSTPLGASDTFTGTAELNPAPWVGVSCKSDTAGTLYFDFSVDGTNYETFPTNGFSVAAGIHEFHTALKLGRYFRVRFVNGASAQSTFRLTTYFGIFDQPSAPVNQTLGLDSDARLVRLFPTNIDKSLGRLGVQGSDKFGYTSGLGTSVQYGTPSSWVDLWAYGGLRTSPTTTFTPYMASTSSADQGIDITWTYLDAAGDEQSVTVATDASDGRTPVSLGVTAQELYRGSNTDSTDLVGDVSVATTNAFTSGVPSNQDEVLAAMPANDGQTQVLARRIPAGKQAVINKININLAIASGAAGSASVVFQIRVTGGVWITRRSYEVTNSAPAKDSPNGMVLPALSDFRVRIRDVSDNNTTISGSVDFDLVDE